MGRKKWQPERRIQRSEGYSKRDSRKRELGKQINNKAVDFITLLIFAGFDPRVPSSPFLPAAGFSCYVEQYLKRSPEEGGGKGVGTEFKRRDNHVRLIVPGGLAHSKRIIHPCYFIPINASFCGHVRLPDFFFFFFHPTLPIAPVCNGLRSKNHFILVVVKF